MISRLSDDSSIGLVRVMIAGPDPLARASLAKALSILDEILVVGMASIDEELQASVDAFRPDVILAELEWETEPTSQQQQILTDLELPLLILSDQALYLRGLGDGWLAPGSSPAQISAAIRAIAHGLVVFDKDMFEGVDASQVDQAEGPVEPLTPRELEVLQMMAEGLTNRGIAFQLGISEYTVKFHVNAIFTKLDAQSRTEASIKAARLGLILL